MKTKSMGVAGTVVAIAVLGSWMVTSRSSPSFGLAADTPRCSEEMARIVGGVFRIGAEINL